MKYILKRSIAITALSLHRMQLRHAFFAIILSLFAFLPATGMAGTGSGSGLSSLGYDCSSGRCICSGGPKSDDCMAMQSDKCPSQLLRCNLRKMCACGGSATAREAIPTAPQIKVTPTAPAAPQKGTTAPTAPATPAAPKQGTTTPKQGTKTTPNLW